MLEEEDQGLVCTVELTARSRTRDCTAAMTLDDDGVRHPILCRASAGRRPSCVLIPERGVSSSAIPPSYSASFAACTGNQEDHERNSSTG